MGISQVPATCSVHKEGITWNMVLNLRTLPLFWNYYLYFSQVSLTEVLTPPGFQGNQLCVASSFWLHCVPFGTHPFCSSSAANSHSPCLSSLPCFPSQHWSCTAYRVFSYFNWPVLPLQCHPSLGPGPLLGPEHLEQCLVYYSHSTNIF